MEENTTPAEPAPLFAGETWFDLHRQLLFPDTGIAGEMVFSECNLSAVAAPAMVIAPDLF
jgi:hypothetical protein